MRIAKLAACVLCVLAFEAGVPLVAFAEECSLPPRDCTGTSSYCVELVPFEPVEGLGYDNYPINGETSTNQYRSYARRDLMMLVKYAAAYVECKAKKWASGNGKPIGLGDMSEKDGSIPGTSDGDPGHPKGTHVKGRDMDIAYYQVTGTDNHLRPVCPYKVNGKNAYHCTGKPNNLDARRTALFIGALLTSDRTRVIGVDGEIEPPVLTEMLELCADGMLPKIACDRKSKLASETKDTGKGWFRHHHHHLHISLYKIKKSGAPAAIASYVLAPENKEVARDINSLTKNGALGHVNITVDPPRQPE